jgi:APA family basic amino acid/polyamine antiporter
MTPVLFAYGGWQTSSFLAAEVREPRKTLPRGLIFGVLAVIAVYTAVNVAYLRGLGTTGLANTSTPASAVMSGVFGVSGAKFIAGGIAFSAFGFLAQSMLTAPRFTSPWRKIASSFEASRGSIPSHMCPSLRSHCKASGPS